jgi:hypothetical protein
MPTTLSSNSTSSLGSLSSNVHLDVVSFCAFISYLLVCLDKSIVQEHVRTYLHCCDALAREGMRCENWHSILPQNSITLWLPRLPEKMSRTFNLPHLYLTGGNENVPRRPSLVNGSQRLYNDAKPYSHGYDKVEACNMVS